MPSSLIIFLLVLGLFSICLIYSMVKRKKMLMSHAIAWIVLVLAIMIASVTTGELKKFADFIGIQEVSNLIFFVGFIVLLVLNLSLTVNFSKQKSININLVQELALTNKRIEELKNANDKKNNN